MADFWVIDLERDVNWGDPAYLCKYCCEKIAEETGFVDVAAWEECQAIMAGLRKEIHDLEAAADSRQRRLDALEVVRATEA